MGKITFRKVAGGFLVLLGLILHLIPFFPAGWIIVIGLELIGIRLLIQGRILDFMRANRLLSKILPKRFKSLNNVT